MKLKYKLNSMHFVTKNNLSKGFTLVEILVVIIIIGVLTAIALPNFLNQTVKAKQAEAKNTVGAVNSSQTAFRVANPRFANSMSELALGLPEDTANYIYKTESTLDFSQTTAQAKNTALKGYSGASERYADSNENSMISSVLCEASVPGISPPDVPSPNSPPDCATVGMVTIGR